MQVSSYGKGIPCLAMAQGGLVPDMLMGLESILKIHVKQNTPFVCLTQKLAFSNTIPGSCCIVCPEVYTIACWEGTSAR